MTIVNNSSNNNIPYKKIVGKKYRPAFRGHDSLILKAFKSDKVDSAFHSLENPTKKLFFVNMTAMVIPRIILDSFRNKYAAAETAFYELYSTVINYALPAGIALGTASLLGKNKTFNPHKVNTKGWVDNKSIDVLGQIYRKEKTPESFSKNIINNLQFYRDGGWNNLAKDISAEKLKEHAAQLEGLIKSSDKNKLINVAGMADSISKHIGVADQIKIVDPKSGKALTSPLKNILGNAVYLGEQFEKGKGNPDAISTIAKNLKHINNTKTVATLAVVSAMGFSVQFINRWITKKRTGKDGFVGYKDFDSKNSKATPDNTSNNATNKQTPSFKGGIPPLESSAPLPTKEQLTWVVYPLGIAGRVLSSRSGDELREISIKSAFSYLNFLIIPNFVANMAAKAFHNKHIFNNEATQSNNNGILNKLKNKFTSINNASVRSYDDIQAYSKYKAHQYLKNPDKIEQQIFKDGILSNPQSMLEKVKNIPPKEKEAAVAQSIKKELNGIKNASTFAGILYSFLTLGVGINILNQIMTNRKRAKELDAKNKIQKSSTDNNIDKNPSSNAFKGLSPQVAQLYSAFKTN